MLNNLSQYSFNVFFHNKINPGKYTTLSCTALNSVYSI